MASGYEDAAERRNWLERLGEMIPGFRGFQDRELRREVDKLQREYLAGRLNSLKKASREKAREHTDAGRLGLLDSFGRLDRKLDGLSQAVRFSDYGVSGFFDVVKINEAELENIYEFDLTFLGEIDELAERIETLPTELDPDPKSALYEAVGRVTALEERWSERKTVISNVVETAGE